MDTVLSFLLIRRALAVTPPPPDVTHYAHTDLSRITTELSGPFHRRMAQQGAQVSCLFCVTLRDLWDFRVAWYRKSSASFSIP